MLAKSPGPGIRGISSILMYSVFFNPNSLRPDKFVDFVPVIVSKVYVGIVGNSAEHRELRILG
jgi:hypothetical protein